MKWSDLIDKWQREFDCEPLPALVPTLVREKLDQFESITADFYDFYTACNGLSCEAFIVFPFFEPSDVKNTWKSLERVNDMSTSPYFRITPVVERTKLFERFFIFAEIGHEECAALDRETGTLWYQSHNEFSRLKVCLREFIELSILEQQ